MYLILCYASLKQSLDLISISSEHKALLLQIFIKGEKKTIAVSLLTLFDQKTTPCIRK